MLGGPPTIYVTSLVVAVPRQRPHLAHRPIFSEAGPTFVAPSGGSLTWEAMIGGSRGIVLTTATLGLVPPPRNSLQLDDEQNNTQNDFTQTE
ncbi:hypothetical protein CRG98_032739 [Punica granatum]|uniref:Uncharacterized protein n=1 Tax=Punica granatum TaxID=22663 RepID=A0A2I0ISE6_PUNGR|nr:hypothetical protein CRG98_032739 [Punica granatum]